MSDPQHEPKKEDLLENLGYEKSDVEPKKLSIGVILFFGFTIVSFLIAYVFVLFIAPDINTTPTEDELARQRLPEEPYPLLQSNITASRDMSDMRLREIEAKESYGVVDPESGVISVPIDVAIDLALSSGRLSTEVGSTESRSPSVLTAGGEGDDEIESMTLPEMTVEELEETINSEGQTPESDLFP